MPRHLKEALPFVLVLFSVACAVTAEPTPSGQHNKNPDNGIALSPSGLSSFVPKKMAPTPSPPTASHSLTTGRLSRLTVEGVTFTVELATTTEARSIGLMHRASLRKNHGMLFVFPHNQKPGFWMKNMLIPIDLFWITADGIIVGIESDLIPAKSEKSPTIHSPPTPIRYVFEVNAGVAERYGIRPGSLVAFETL